MNKKKPCPFCGDENLEIISLPGSRVNTRKGWIECNNCGARGPIEHAETDSIESKAIFQWNARFRWNNRFGESDGKTIRNNIEDTY